MLMGKYTFPSPVFFELKWVQAPGRKRRASDVVLSALACNPMSFHEVLEGFIAKGGCEFSVKA